MEKIRVYRLDKNKVFDDFMRINVRFAAIAVFMIYFLKDQMDYQPPLVGLIYLCAVFLSIFWTKIYVFVLRRLFKVEVSDQGLRCLKVGLLPSYRLMQWSEMTNIRSIKSHRIRCLYLKCEQPPFEIQLPIKLENQADFLKTIRQYLPAEHFLLKYFSTV